MDMSYWLMFFTVSLAINISPGPDVIFVLTKTLSYGRKAGVIASMAVTMGALAHVAAAALGLSAILVSSAYAFTLVKIAGVLYLLYLAIQAFRSSGAGLRLNSDKKKAPASHWNIYRQGVLVAVLNPKTAIFFMAFLPQFVREQHGSIPSQLLLLGLLVVAGAFLVELVYVFSTHYLSRKVKSNRRFNLWLDRVIGAVFMSLGVKLAIS